MKAADVGRRFLDYFESKEHTIVPSASLLYNDPTLLFVNAGMVPFKAYYTGEEAAPFTRAASVQKCVRTLDIEEVGKTTRHGTFFQMNGNFAFGDYFKAEAIEYAWELVTNEQHNGGYGFDPGKIWVTALHGDQETIDLWQKVGVPREHIQERGLKDNYWHMGIPGPGGPCSEIYVDRGPEFGPDGGPEADEDRFLEIWNLVFQTEELSHVRAKDDFDVLRPLPSKNIDTGMGLERVAYLLQGVGNMYETDQVFPVIQRAGELAGKKYGVDEADDIRLRVVGDHIRSSLMLMTDGVHPGNEARGYVLRRLLRRSIRAMRLLGVHEPVVGELLTISHDLMREGYPEVETQWDRVLSVATAEEETFRRTLTQGSQLFDTAVKQVREQKSSTVSGEQAFQLHDTYGFPIDLTLEMAEEQGLQVDRQRFVELMDEQRARAKADAKAKRTGGVSTEVFRELRDRGETPFLGYTELSVPTKVRGIIHDGVLVDHAPAGAVVEVVLEETPFYAEAGGQDADTGTIQAGGFALEVVDVQRPVPGLVVHSVEATGDLVVGDEVLAQVDGANRIAASQAHTATHIIHAALRELVGKNATQAGSYNKPGYLRFDFSAQHGLSDQLKAEIEERANTAIRDNFEVTDTQLKLEEAKELGAMAMFGEKYPPIVRMVELAGPWSRELCGGTHVQRTSEIGMLTLLGEQSIGSGTRRVEALVSTDAFKHLAGERALVHGLSDILKVQPDQLTDRVGKLVAQLKDAEKQIAELKAQQLAAGAGEIIASARTVGPVLLVSKQLDGVAAGDLRTLATDLRGRVTEQAAVVALVGGTAEKPAIVVATTPGARDAGIKAGALVGLAAPLLGGKGGGKDDLAQGGGTDASGAPAALAAIEADLAGR
ncbi:alanine--tRNA ligase [Aestuariimicrobium sp. Y1814]|uniref:alanine--tRNA ligase n=1 Tax=Aestuariimicrobium sp. Y1814 TaxID=3418742 RepID=UPI003DA6EE5A